MPDTSKQASAYLSEADTTLKSARVLLDDDPDSFASQIVKNAYDALEQALSAGIAGRDEAIPRRHGAKIQRYFEPFDDEETEQLQQTAFEWHAQRSNAQYVDFRGDELSIPSSNFDVDDARQIVSDTEEIIEFVRQRIDD